MVEAHENPVGDSWLQNRALVPKVGIQRRLLRHESSIRILFFCASNCLSASSYLSSMRRLDLAKREEIRLSEGAKGTWRLNLKKDDVMRASWRAEGAGG